MAESTGAAYLRTFPDFELGNVSAAKTFGLERVLALLEEVGSPHLRLRVIHIAGTKGKGSTAAAIAAIGTAAGYRTGMFTQPHLIEVNERFMIDGRAIDDDALSEVVLNRIRPAVDGLAARGLTGIQQFEAQVAIALLWFEAQGVDLAVLETGLGGRLDGTNVVPRPLVATLTPIGYDHMAVLGHSLAEIAGEKAAIIKAGVPAVVSPQGPEARAVFVDRCRAMGSPLLLGDRDWQALNIHTSLDGTTFDLRLSAALPWPAPPGGAGQGSIAPPEAPTAPMEYVGLRTTMLGAHQAVNAAAAAVSVLQAAAALPLLNEEAIRRGLAAVVWPGRLQVAAVRPTVVLDGAHTPESAAILVQAMRDLFPGVRPIVICGVQADKDIPGIAAPLAAIASLVLATRARHRRAAAPEVVAAAFSAAGARSVESVDEPAAALELARRRADPTSVILVTGSLYLVGEVLVLTRGQATGENRR